MDLLRMQSRSVAAVTAVQLPPAAWAQQTVTEKIRPAHVDLNAMVRLLASDSPAPPTPADAAASPAQLVAPKGASDLLGYPLDKSLLV